MRLNMRLSIDHQLQHGKKGRFNQNFLCSQIHSLSINNSSHELPQCISRCVTVPCLVHAGDLNASKMLFPEDYHNISLVFKAAQLMKQQDPTRVVPGEHKLHFNLLHLHVCFYCWVGCAWHCIFVLDKRLGQHSFLGLGCHFYFLTSRGAQEENVALSCFISFVDFSIAFWKASRCSV